MARKKALQALYQWDLTNQEMTDILAQFNRFQDMSKVDNDYFVKILRTVSSKQSEIDAAISPHLPRTIDDLDPIERSALRLCCFELMESVEVPYKVVINEALELTKEFGAEQGHKFVNGVADKIAQQIRNHEINRSSTG
ncbi:MAG: transcription antitermination factor NusB [Pseudomonadota bacterium]